MSEIATVLSVIYCNAGPGCRQPYRDCFQISLVQEKEEAAQPIPGLEGLYPDAAAMDNPDASPCFKSDYSGMLAADAASPGSPERDLHINEEQLWPSLSAVAASNRGSAAATPTCTTSSSRYTSPSETPCPTPVAPSTAARGVSHGRVEQNLQQRVESCQAEHLPNEGSSSSSSATTATTPQSPASSVVMYKACAASSVAEMFRGTCQVLLAPSCLAALSVDQQGLDLAVSLQEAVKAGSISVKQAASSLVSYLRQRQLSGSTASNHQQCNLSQLPLLQGAGTGLAAKAGTSAGLHKGQAMLASPLLTSSSATMSDAPSFAQWGCSDGIISPMSSLHLPGAGLFDGWTVQQSYSHHTPQQADGMLRSNGRLPLYARGSAAGLSPGEQSSAGASFPGFHRPSLGVQNQSSTILMSPPGFSRSYQPHLASEQHT